MVGKRGQAAFRSREDPLFHRLASEKQPVPFFLILTLAASGAFAQDQRPLPRGAPEAFVGPAPRVHVRVHEDLEPDRLRELARPGVTLWLSTRTNTLRASTLENVARFDAAWVQLRAPLAPYDARTFSKLPSAGAWVTPDSLGAVGRFRRIAVGLEGPLDEALLAKVSAARPAEVRWAPQGAIDLLSWGELRRLPGRRIVTAEPQALLPVKCESRRAGDPSTELHVASLLALSSDVYPCGTGTRVVVQPEVETWLLQSMIVRDPSVELVVEIGAEAPRALAAKGLLERLQLGPSR